MSAPAPQDGDALIVVDIQNDFVSGALAVPDGEAVIAPLNRAIDAFAMRGLTIGATRDWHPPDHCSFRSQGGPWPPHCVAGTPGAEYHPGLRLPAGAIHVRKATARDREAYSGFQGTTLESDLRRRGVRRVFVGGLATDYCVLNTVRDARRLGFDLVVLADACRAVNVRATDGADAEAEMRRLGAEIANTDRVVVMG